MQNLNLLQLIEISIALQILIYFCNVMTGG